MTLAEAFEEVSRHKKSRSMQALALRRLASEVKKLEADKKRLDWLADKNNLIGNVQLPTACVMKNMHSLRAAIDMAMTLPETGSLKRASDNRVATRSERTRPMSDQNQAEKQHTVSNSEFIEALDTSKRRCNNCKFFMTEDHGYSNYTVEETTVHCLKKANQYFPAEESYSWEIPGAPDYPQLAVAATCSHYKEGEGMVFDVDGEVTIDDYANDAELVEAYNVYQASI